MHIGCDSGAIEKPEYRDSLDIFDTDVISAYKIYKRDNEQIDGEFVYE